MGKPFRTVVGGQVSFAILPDAPCPCGSASPAEKCCLTSRGLVKQPVSSSPPGAATGNQVERCYAAQLNDCGSGISREHYVSEVLLKLLDSEGALTVSGLSWTGDESKKLSPNSLASKVLCERHNSALATLDAIALSIFQAFDERGAAGSKQRRLHLFSGHDLERWLLKALCGLASSNSFVLDRHADLSIPKYWLDILFSGTQFPDGQGLYVCRSKGHEFKGPSGLAIQAIISGHGRLTGIGFKICGYELVLSMSGFSSRRFDGREFAYRPLELYATANDFEKSIVFSWDGQADLGTIAVSLGET